MATANSKKTEIKPVIIEKVEYRVVTSLFGLLRWERKQLVTRIGDRLDILTTEEPTEIYLNGKLLSTADKHLPKLEEK